VATGTTRAARVVCFPVSHFALISPMRKIDLERGTAARRPCSSATRRPLQVLGTSVKQPEGLVALRDLLRGRESRAHRSIGRREVRLLNALDPGSDLRIGRDQREVGYGEAHHPRRLVVPVATGVMWCTRRVYGERVGTWGIDPELLGAYFAEFQPFLDQLPVR